MLHDFFAPVITDARDIPDGSAQQMLHAVRAGLPGPLRDRPAVLARQIRHQAEHQPRCPAPGFDPCELFLDSKLWFPKLRVVRRLLQKKLGFRTLFDVIPLDAIHSVEVKQKWLQGEGLEVYFHDQKGRPHRLFLKPQNQELLFRELNRVRV